jgi:hypothetical protein
MRHTGSERAGSHDGATGSNDGLGLDFRPFGINRLEMVDQNSASWNPLIGWLRSVEALRSAA